MEGNLYWVVFWDGHKHHVWPHRAKTRRLAVRSGLEHLTDMTLLAVISDEMNLSVPQILELAEVLPPPGSSLIRALEESIQSMQSQPSKLWQPLARD